MAASAALSACACMALSAVLWAMAARQDHMYEVRLGPLPWSLIALSAFAGILASDAIGGLREVAVLVAVSACSVCAYTDAKTGFIYDIVVYPAIGLVVILTLFSGDNSYAVMGFKVCYLPLAVAHYASRNTCLGLGDVKMALLIGLALGPVAGGISIALAFCIAGVLLAPRLLRNGESFFRFGPYLTTGTILSIACLYTGYAGQWRP